MPTPAPTSKKRWWRRLLRTELLCPSLRCRKRCHLPLRRGPPWGPTVAPRCLKESGGRSLRLVHRGAKRLKAVRSRSDSALAASSTSHKASDSGRRGGSQTRDPESVVTDCSGSDHHASARVVLVTTPHNSNPTPPVSGRSVGSFTRGARGGEGRLSKCAASQRAAFSLPP